MSYSSYGNGCDWYVFWSRSKAEDEREQRGDPKPKSEETLALWHCDHRASGPEFTYAAVVEMLRSGDFTSVPGYSEADRELLVECLTAFVEDVDRERPSD